MLTLMSRRTAAVGGLSAQIQIVVQTHAVVLLVIGAVALGFAPLFVRLSPASPEVTAFWRVALAGVAFLAVAAAVRPVPVPMAPRWSAPWLVVAAGLAFAADVVAMHWSIALTSVANATVLVNLAPVWVGLMVWAATRIAPGRAWLGSTAVALGGIGLMVWGDRDVAPTAGMGEAVGIAAGIFYAVYIVLVKAAARHYGMVTIMAGSALVSAAAILPFVAGGLSLALPVTGWLVLAVLALGCHAGGQGLVTLALKHLSAGFVSFLLLVQPVVAFVLGWLVLGEAMTALQLAGAALALGAVLWVARRGSRGED